MPDYLVKVAPTKAPVFACAAVTTKLVEEARKRHHTLPTATAALGRLLTGAALLSANLKNNQTLTIQIIGNGPLQEIFCEAEAKGNIRGFVRRPYIHLPLKNEKLDVSRAIGREGKLAVVKDLGLKEPYRGVVKLISGEIAEDLSYYLAISEQQPSAISLGVLIEKNNQVSAAGGFLIQPLPGTDANSIDKIEKAVKQLPPVSELIKKGNTPEMIIKKILPEFSFRVIERKSLQFACRCSKKKCRETLLALGQKELQFFISKGKFLPMRCTFCNTEYLFSVDELKKLLKKIEGEKE